MKSYEKLKQYPYNMKICISGISFAAYQIEHPDYNLNTLRSKINGIFKNVPGVVRYNCLNPYCFWYFTEQKTPEWEDLAHQLLHEEENKELRFFTAAIYETFPDYFGKPAVTELIEFWRNEERSMYDRGVLSDHEVEWMIDECPLIGETEAEISLDSVEYE